MTALFEVASGSEENRRVLRNMVALCRYPRPSDCEAEGHEAALQAKANDG